MQRRERAIILRRTPYGEADLIVTFFGRDAGRVSGIAKHARKSVRRFGGALEPGSFVDLAYKERRGQLVWIDEAKVLRGVTGAMKSLDRLNAMARTLELAIAFLQEHQTSPEKFDLLELRLSEISSGAVSPADELAFQIEWLKFSGFGPQLASCIRCGRTVEGETHWSLDFDRGGLLCPGCGRGVVRRLPLTKGAAEGMRLVAAGANFEDEACAAEAGRLIRRYTEYVLGRPLRT